MSVLTFAVQALSSLPSLIEAGVDVYDLIVQTNKALEKMKEERRDPSAEQWQEMNDMIDNLRAMRPDISNNEE